MFAVRLTTLLVKPSWSGERERRWQNEREGKGTGKKERKGEREAERQSVKGETGT